VPIDLRKPEIAIMKLWSLLSRAAIGTRLVSSTVISKRKVPMKELRCLSQVAQQNRGDPKRNPFTSEEEQEEFSGGAYVLLVIPVVALGLGTWQVFRWRWKLGQIAELESKTLAPAVDLPANLDDLEDLDYRKVKVRGKFDYQREALLGPRSLNKDGSAPKEGIIKKVRNDSGYYLVTPFKVSGRDLTILVNRGWIPNRREINHRTIPDDQEVEITGIVRKAETRPQFVSQRSGSSNLFLYRDIPGMCQLLGTDPVLLDLADVKGTNLTTAYPIPGQTRATLRNDHVSYFVTWFSLSFITSLMWHRMFILRKPLR